MTNYVNFELSKDVEKNPGPTGLSLLTFDKQAGQSQSLVPTAWKTSRGTNSKAFPLIYIFSSTALIKENER